MKSHLVILLLSLSTSAVLFGQNTIGVTDFQPDLVDEGYTLVYPHNQPNVYLLDMCGEVVHTWTNADTLRPGNVAYLQENGDIVLTYRPQLFADDPIWAGGGGATVERRTWDNEVLWSFTLNDGTGRLHHDIEVKPDGNVFAIAWEHFSAAEAIQAGRDTTIVPEDGLWSEMILELAPDGNGGANVVWEWHAWDHLVQDFNSTVDNFGVVSETPRLIDINYGTPSNQPSDWLHINAIDFNPFFGHLLLSVPTFDELWIVDYSNFDEGQLIWRWGNPEAYGMGTAEDKQLFYQHDCHWVYDHVTLANSDFGKIAVFNNRVPGNNDQAFSSVHLLNPSYTDYDNNFATETGTGTYLPSDFDWSYTAPDSLYSSGLSSFQRLENGNSLICYGRWGDTREYTPDGQLAWRYKTPLVNAGGFAAPVSQGSEPTINQNLTFRAHRYPADFPGFNGVELTAQGVLELDPSPVVACGGIGGCTDSMACNYDSSATIDDGSCGETVGASCDDGDDTTTNDVIVEGCGCFGEAIVEGCMDEMACNYDEFANVDDDSCAFPFDECGDGLIYDEDCECNGNVDDVAGKNNLGVGVFPNPTSGELTVQVEGVLADANVQVLDAAGRIAWNKESLQIQGNYMLDLSELSDGLYTVVIQSDGLSAVKRLAIQR